MFPARMLDDLAYRFGVLMTLHRVVVVGGGAGGLELVTRLGRTLGRRGQAQITLVDAHLTHIWKPLLHEVAAVSLDMAANEPNYIAQAKWNHFEFQIGRLRGLDREQRLIQISATPGEGGSEVVPARTLGYDSLVIAVGSRTNDFGTAGAAQHQPGSGLLRFSRRSTGLRATLSTSLWCVRRFRRRWTTTYLRWATVRPVPPVTAGMCRLVRRRHISRHRCWRSR